MRAKEFIIRNRWVGNDPSISLNEQSSLDDQEASTELSINNALLLIQDDIAQGVLKNPVPTELIIDYIKHTGLTTFEYADLLTANEKYSYLSDILKDITPNYVEINTKAESDNEISKEPDKGSKKSQSTPTSFSPNRNPEDTVKAMAKSAVKRRQK